MKNIIINTNDGKQYNVHIHKENYYEFTLTEGEKYKRFRDVNDITDTLILVGMDHTFSMIGCEHRFTKNRELLISFIS